MPSFAWVSYRVPTCRKSNLKNKHENNFICWYAILQWYILLIGHHGCMIMCIQAMWLPLQGFHMRFSVIGNKLSKKHVCSYKSFYLLTCCMTWVYTPNRATLTTFE